MMDGMMDGMIDKMMDGMIDRMMERMMDGMIDEMMAQAQRCGEHTTYICLFWFIFHLKVILVVGIS